MPTCVRNVPTRSTAAFLWWAAIMSGEVYSAVFRSRKRRWKGVVYRRRQRRGDLLLHACSGARILRASERRIEEALLHPVQQVYQDSKWSQTAVHVFPGLRVFGRA